MSKNKEILEKRLGQARESLEEARFLRDENISNLAILTKLYHAMIYGLLGLFGLEDIGTLTHQDLIERFEREFVSTGRFKKDYLEALRLAYGFTHECDCAHMKEPEASHIAYLQPIAEEFINELSLID
ncbi:MAG: hypothetical protein GXO99_02215 [Nitrospirae bacterium]|nr:hypothetical protein [Nitrospirota bacterium]